MQRTVLAIDFGTVRVGTALSRASLAVPLVVLQNSPSIFEELRKLIQEHEVTTVVVGISEGEMAIQTKAFAAALEKMITIPLVFADETLSSHTVHQKLKLAKESTRRGPIDHFAAAEFLQEWLDEHPVAET